MTTEMKATTAAITLILGLGAAGCGSTQEVHQHGNSTSVIDQRGGGPSSTTVIRSDQGQTIIKEDGRSSSVVIQQSSGGIGTTPTVREPTTVREPSGLARPSIQDRLSGFGRGTEASHGVRPPSDPVPVASGQPTAAEEFRGEAMNRVRPPVPESR